MKKKVFSIIGVAVFAVAVAFNINAVVGAKSEMNVSLANLESLVFGESGGSGNCTYQSMAYCGWTLTYACKSSYTAESCRRYQCCPY